MAEQTEPYDPSKHKVDEVQKHLDSLPDTDEGKAERQRILEAEAAGQNRSTLVNAGKPKTTEGAKFADAAKAVPEVEGEHYRQGYVGAPPSVAKGEDLTLAGVLKRQNGEG